MAGFSGFGKQMAACGELQLIMGPMFSGKSSELLRRARRYSFAKHAVLVLKYEADRRYSDDSVATHDKVMMNARGCLQLKDVAASEVEAHDVIAIDEGQFFPDLLHFAELWANQGKCVIVAALDADFRRESFGSVCALVPKAESVTKLTSVCTMCQREASFTKRTVLSETVELIGGSESYIPVCRSCFFTDRPTSTGDDSPSVTATSSSSVSTPQRQTEEGLASSTCGAVGGSPDKEEPEVSPGPPPSKRGGREEEEVTVTVTDLPELLAQSKLHGAGHYAAPSTPGAAAAAAVGAPSFEHKTPQH